MMQSIKRYCRIFRGIRLPWFLLFIAILIAFLNAQIGVKTITISASFIDASRKAINTEDFVEYILYLLATGVLAVGDTYLSNLAYEKINMAVRVKIWNKIMRLPSKYYDTDDGNELISRVTSDASNSSYYFMLAISTITSIYSAVVVFKRLFAFEATLAAWTLLIIPCVFGIGGIYGFMGYHAGLRGNVTMAATMAYLAERVRNLRMIKAHGTQKKETDTAQRLFKKQFGAELLSEMTIAVIQLGIQILNCVCIVIAFAAGGKMVQAGTLTIGRLVAFYSLSGLVAVNMMQLYMNFGAFTQVNGAMKKVSEVLDAGEEETEGKAVPETDEDIRLEHVTFAYGETPVLQDVSFTVPAKKVTAIIGANGAGKSTVFKLLERMYDPEAGEIRFGDADIRDFGLKAWRNTFAMVAQNSPLLSGSVRENILYGVDRPVSEEELIAVAKEADVYDFVMATPGGFDAQVGVGGTNFSGGQRQCIAIARALMCKPRYLLLDEATSNLDVTCECRVSKTFAKLMEGRTTLMIAHSYAATCMADHIVVMNNGRVEAEGTPQELMKSCEYYRIFARSSQETACKLEGENV